MKAEDFPRHFRSASHNSTNEHVCAVRKRNKRIHASSALLVKKFLRGSLLFELPWAQSFVRRNKFHFRLLPGVLFLCIIATAQGAAAFSLGWLILWWYPTAVPWLNDVSGLHWPEIAWTAVLSLLVGFLITLRVLQVPNLFFRSLPNWTTVIAGPAMLTFEAPIWLPSGDLWKAGAVELAETLAFGLLCVLVAFSPQILAFGATLIVCGGASLLFWSYGPLRSWRVYVRELVRWSNVPLLQKLVLLLGGITGGAIGGLMIIIIAISIIRRSSHFMERLMDYAPAILLGIIAAGVAAVILYSFARGFIDRIRGVEGWAFAGSNPDGLVPNLIARSIARGAATTVTGAVKFFASVIGEAAPQMIGLIIVAMPIISLAALWDAVGSSVRDAISKLVFDYRATYSQLAIFAVFGCLIVLLGAAAKNSKKPRP